jgi:hypothetical protein
VNRRLLAEELAHLACVVGSDRELLQAFDIFVRTRTTTR